MEAVTKQQALLPDEPVPAMSMYASSADYWKAMYEYREKEAHLLSEEIIRLRAFIESQASAPRAEAVEAKDAQRLDWLERQFRTCSLYMDGNHRYAPTHGVYNMRGPTFRAAIDAAIAQGAEGQSQP